MSFCFLVWCCCQSTWRITWTAQNSLSHPRPCVMLLTHRWTFPMGVRKSVRKTCLCRQRCTHRHTTTFIYNECIHQVIICPSIHPSIQEEISSPSTSDSMESVGFITSASSSPSALCSEAPSAQEPIVLKQNSSTVPEDEDKTPGCPDLTLTLEGATEALSINSLSRGSFGENVVSLIEWFKWMFRLYRNIAYSTSISPSLKKNKVIEKILTSVIPGDISNSAKHAERRWAIFISHRILGKPTTSFSRTDVFT